MNPQLEYKLKNVLFIDIETRSKYGTFGDLSPVMQKVWAKKAHNLKNEDNLSVEELYLDRAALFPEFGSILCIGIGGVSGGKAKIDVIHEQTEGETIKGFFEIVNKYPQPSFSLVAHNGKEFDYPYICKRAIINGIELPTSMQFAGKKPWEILHQDTLDMWRFGDFKSYTSLELLCEVLDIATPKDGIDGSMVNKLFWDSPVHIDRILEYCKADVVATMQVWLKINMSEQLPPESITIK